MALKNINLIINSGDFISLVGPSGSGKSTLLHLIALLDQPSSGYIFFKKKNLLKLTDALKDEFRKKYISIIYQQNNLLSDFTALENVSIPMIINGENIFVLSETLSKVLNEINIIKSQNMAVAVNEEVIEKINWENYKIKSGDMIEIVQPLKGG